MDLNGWTKFEVSNLDVSSSLMVEGEGPAFSRWSMSLTTRLRGFVACAIVGFVLSLVGSFLLLTGSLIGFAFVYAGGTIVSLISTGFLIGFKFQAKNMFKPVRVVATFILFACIISIFVVATLTKNGLICMLLVIAEFLAFTWYSISYIPYARDGVKQFFTKMF